MKNYALPAIIAAVSIFATSVFAHGGEKNPQIAKTRRTDDAPGATRWMRADLSSLMADLNRGDSDAAFRDAVLISADESILQVELGHKDVVIHNLQHPSDKYADVSDILSQAIAFREHIKSIYAKAYHQKDGETVHKPEAVY